MRVFVCRWPNGDLTIVEAANRDDAICRLDEIDNAESAHVFPISNFLLDLKLGDDGRLATDSEHTFGEVCEPEIMENAYPVLQAARHEVAGTGSAETSNSVIQQAVQRERDRIGGSPPSVPIDPKLRALKAVTGMPDALLRKLTSRPDEPSE